jgi:hypothetical protein
VHLHHIGVVVKDIEQAIAAHASRWSALQVSPIVDDETQRARVVLLSVGRDTLIELVEPGPSASSVLRSLECCYGNREASIDWACSGFGPFAGTFVRDEADRLAMR